VASFALQTMVASQREATHLDCHGLQSAPHLGIGSPPLPRFNRDVNRKWIKITVALLVVALLAGLAVVMLRPKENLFPPLPNPNGYDDIVFAAQGLPASPANYWELPANQLRPFVEQCQPSFEQLRVGLARDCRVPLPRSDEELVAVHLPRLSSFHAMAKALSAAHRFNTLEDRTSDASQTAEDSVMLGLKSARGGLLIDALIALSREVAGVEWLQALLDRLDAAQCKRIIARTEQLDATRETPESIINRDKRWSRSAGDLPSQISTWFESGMTKEVRRRFIRRHHEATLLTRRLLLSLAARAYELERGKPPSRAADLVPDYLQAVPKDPENGADMELKR
jgi:hypothetical protein